MTHIRILKLSSHVFVISKCYPAHSCMLNVYKQEVCNIRMHELYLRIIEGFSEQNWQITSVV